MRSSVFDYSNSTTALVVSQVLKDLGSPYALALAGHLNRGDFTSAVAMELPLPSAYTDANSFRVDYLAYNLIRKSDFLDLGVDRRQAAVDAFLESEESCKIVNRFGRNPLVIDRGALISPDSLEAKIFKAKELIKHVLGPFDWNECATLFGFSSGASTRLRRKTGSPFYKYQGKPEVTRGSALLAVCDIWSIPLWRNQMFDTVSSDPTEWVSLVEGSRADTVPKTCKTDRFICIEPCANMRLQRGIGGVIRRKLRDKAKIFLEDQTVNQRLACIGSGTGSLATIDLSRASDSIALGLVRTLLPGDWYEAICLTRSPRTNLDGTWVDLEKVSSMGNGFTFELETLIFWALSKAVLELHEVGDRRLAVYGDDIVIHNSAAEPLIELLSYVGFETNKDKSFVSGPFRESCGKHYFYGVDVSPFHIKEVIESEDRFYWFLNSYREWLLRADRPLTGYLKLYRLLERRVRGGFCKVPFGTGFDAGIEVSDLHSGSIWSFRKQGFLYKRLRAVRRVHRPNGTAALLTWLSLAGNSVSDDVLLLFKGDTVYKRFSACTSRWPSQEGSAHNRS